MSAGWPERAAVCRWMYALHTRLTGDCDWVLRGRLTVNADCAMLATAVAVVLDKVQEVFSAAGQWRPEVGEAER